MATINLSPYEREDIINYLKYAKEKISSSNNKKGNEKWSNKKYDMHRIDYLINVLSGIYHSYDTQLVSKEYREKTGRTPAMNDIDLGL